MSSVLLFCIGSVIFATVTTAAFLYGLALFRSLEARDLADTADIALPQPVMAELAVEPTPT